MRTVDIASPHFTDRVDEAMYAVRTYDAAPPLLDGDRALLMETLEAVRGKILERGVDEQLLHGEPHPGNLLRTRNGLVFIDLETCCRGPVEFDLAHVPQDVSDCYPGADPERLSDCRLLVLAMVAAWRLEPGDQLPNGQQARHELIGALHH